MNEHIIFHSDHNSISQAHCDLIFTNYQKAEAIFSNFITSHFLNVPREDNMLHNFFCKASCPYYIENVYDVNDMDWFDDLWLLLQPCLSCESIVYLFDDYYNPMGTYTCYEVKPHGVRISYENQETMNQTHLFFIQRQTILEKQQEHLER